MDLLTFAPWVALALSVITLGDRVFGWFTAGEKKIAADLSKFSRETAEEIDRLEKRVAAIENDMKHLPDSKDVMELKLGMSEMRGQMNLQAEVMGSVARTVQRLEAYLLEKGK